MLNVGHRWKQWAFGEKENFGSRSRYCVGRKNKSFEGRLGAEKINLAKKENFGSR
jgi:hypothetical protein